MKTKRSIQFLYRYDLDIKLKCLVRHTHVMAILTIDNLSVHYQSGRENLEAIDKASFSLPEKESIGIVGESGSGKSTLALSIMRSLQKNSHINGKIIFNGNQILSMPDLEFTRNLRWKKISMVFQGAMNSLDPVFSIRKQLEEILKKHGYDQDLTKKIEEAVLSVELPADILDKYPHELSGGMKQRVVIAMALLLKPKLIIADEPTTALDVLVQAQIIALLKKLKMEGMSIMLISHDLAIVSEIAEKIAVMYAGQVIEYGNLSDIYKNPLHPYTDALLNSVPKIHEDKKLIALEGSPPSLIRPPPGCRFYERCPRAMEKCKKDPPKINTSSGYVLCWLYE